MLNLLSFVNSRTLRDSSDDIHRIEKIEDLGGKGPRVAAYTRVSSKKQANEGVSLEVQRDDIEDMKKQFSPSIIYWFEDAGATGLLFFNREIKKIQELAESGCIDELWVTEIDRLGRDCKKLLIYCLKLCEDGVIIRTPKRVYQLSDLAGLLSLFLQAHGAEEENRKRAERAVASKARNFKMKLWNRPVPLGYEKSGDWIIKKQDWTPLILDVYSLFLLHKKIGAVCYEINRKYRLFLREKDMTRYRIRRLLSDPVYIGKPEHLGHTVVDPLLQFIDEESFSKVQVQLKSIKTRHMKKGEGVNKLIEKYGISAIAFLEQIELRHKKCGGKMVRNGTRTIDGIKRYTYLCKKCRDQFWIPTKSQLNRINNEKKKYGPIIETLKKSINDISKNPTNVKQKTEKDKKITTLKTSKLSDFFY